MQSRGPDGEAKVNKAPSEHLVLVALAGLLLIPKVVQFGLHDAMSSSDDDTGMWESFHEVLRNGNMCRRCILIRSSMSDSVNSRTGSEVRGLATPPFPTYKTPVQHHAFPQAESLAQQDAAGTVFMTAHMAESSLLAQGFTCCRGMLTSPVTLPEVCSWLPDTASLDVTREGQSKVHVFFVQCPTCAPDGQNMYSSTMSP